MIDLRKWQDKISTHVSDKVDRLLNCFQRVRMARHELISGEVVKAYGSSESCNEQQCSTP